MLSRSFLYVLWKMADDASSKKNLLLFKCEVICFHTEVGFLVNQGYQKDLQIKQFHRIFTPCFHPEYLNHAHC